MAQEKTQEEKDVMVANLISSFVSQIPHYIDNKIMSSFDVKFEYNNKVYTFSLTESDKNEKIDLQYNPN